MMEPFAEKPVGRPGGHTAHSRASDSSFREECAMTNLAVSRVEEVYRSSFSFRPDPSVDEKHRRTRHLVPRLIFIFITFAALTLATVAAPIEMFQSNTLCLTMWGSRKAPCRQHNTYSALKWICDERNVLLQTARVFSIISIVLLLAALVLGVLFHFNLTYASRSKLFCAVPSLGAVMCLAITFGCVAGVYVAEKCAGEESLRARYSFGAGFALLIIAFTLQSFATVSIVFA